MFPFLRRKNKFFRSEELHLIIKAVKAAEKQTSGEVRVFIESRCPFMDAIDRATELFSSLKMENTEHRNAALVYVAMKDRQLAVYGDKGIHEKVGTPYWNHAVAEMIGSFNKDNYAEGISNCVLKIGDALKTHFPYDKDTDKNELPDDIVFGR
jgi:uncharacterized membrane protein